MAYKKNAFCWHGAISTDTDKAKTFYADVVGWSVLTQQMGDEEATMFVASDIPRAHLMEPPMEGIPSHWHSYLKVDDADASAAAAVANGGAIVVPGTDIPPGRFVGVASPSGAMFYLFTEADPDSAQNAPGGPGAIHWVELHSKDIAADLAWLSSSFGITNETMPLPDGGGDYHLLKSGDDQIGGAMTAMNDQAPSMWLVWFNVADVDAAVARAADHGGRTVAPMMDAPGIGRMAIVSDSTGGVFGLITPPAA